MIASPMSRRAVMGGIVAVTALSGCSASDGSAAEVADAADRDRLKQARDLSQQILNDIEATTDRRPRMAEKLAGAHALHSEQIAQFARAARITAAATIAGTPSEALTLKTMSNRERALASQFRAWALQSDRGDVAALLASAAAGIDQTLMGRR